MLIAQFNRSSHFVHHHLPLTGRDENEHSSSSLAILCHRLQPMPTKRIRAKSTSIAKAAISNPFRTKTTTVKGVITIQPTLWPSLHRTISGTLADGISDFFGWSFLLELVSKDHNNWNTVQAYARYDFLDSNLGVYMYNCKFEVPHDFGEIGAVVVENEYHKKMFFNKIELDNGVTFTCDCWVHSKHDNPDKRIFFSDQCNYLPSETPNALTQLRAKDLESLQGNGKGERLHFERIYDYDVYNDLGNPDENFKLARPALGGKKFPYPRRCRTGRNMSCKDPSAETRSSEPFYVPLDEDFSEIKDITFNARALYSVLHGAIPNLDSLWTDRDKGFSLFTSIDLLYNQGVNVPAPPQGLQNILPRLFKRTADNANTLIKFEVPETLKRDSFSWLSDEEFCRQMLAGLNPCSIQLVTEWPLVSKLDPDKFGQAESAITKEIVEAQIRGFMTLEEALTQKKLFMLDYHDLLLPYVNITRELEGTTLYGSRTLMFLTPDETLRPIAVELTRPPYYEKPQWKHVYTPTSDSTGAWLWKLAKAHVLAHDSGYHQLVSHWLRTHCVTEPYVIATHRQLSQMHPIHRLLIPHFRYTLQINAIARHSLINAGGTIESTFSPGKYSMQLSSAAYDQLWRFDHEALPADLISRGMAIEDQNEPHGIKLTINDYPYANDGLLLWDAIEHWATSYVNHYYPQANLVESDKELQLWWYEIRTVGHGDKKDEPWWPQLKTQDDLIKIVSTIMWVAAGHHSAVNFGQYDFAGYFPNRPSIARTKMPNEDPTDKEWEEFMKRPEEALLKCFPSQIQATIVMAVLDVLSSHSPDEKYIGGNIEKGWEAEPAIKEAFEEFRRRLNKLDDIIDSKNADPHWKNRRGAGMVPYQIFKRYSECGVTGKGVPNSISI